MKNNKHLGLKDFTHSPIKKSFKENTQFNPTSILSQLNTTFNKSLITEELYEKAVSQLDSIIKARNIKYYKREGMPGSYKYYYTKEEYEKEKGGGEKKENPKRKEKEEKMDLSKHTDKELHEAMMVRLKSGMSENHPEIKQIKKEAERRRESGKKEKTLEKSDIYYALQGADLKFEKKGKDLKEKVLLKLTDYAERRGEMVAEKEALKIKIMESDLEVGFSKTEYGEQCTCDYTTNSNKDCKIVYDFNNFVWKINEIDKDIKSLKVLLENFEDEKIYTLSASQLSVLEKAEDVEIIYKEEVLQKSNALALLKSSHTQLIPKKVQVKGKDGKIYMAIRWVDPDEGGEVKKRIPTFDNLQSKYFRYLVGEPLDKIQEVVSCNKRNKSEKVRDLIALGIVNKKQLVMLTGCDGATPYSILKKAGIDFGQKDGEGEARVINTLPQPALTEEDESGEVRVRPNPLGQGLDNMIEQELQALWEADGIEFEDVNKVNPITGKDKVDETMDMYVDMVAKKEAKLAMFYGLGGVGKTYGVKQILTNPKVIDAWGSEYGNEKVEYDSEINPDKTQYDFIKFTGKITPTKLYKALYEHNGKIILLDDCDSVLMDEESVNMLKAACDTTGEDVTYDGAPIKADDGETRLPTRFRFRGSVIFITNLSETQLRDKASPLLDSRALRLNTARTMEQTIDKLDRIKDFMPFEDSGGEPLEVSKQARDAAISVIKKYSKYIRLEAVNGRTLGSLAKIYERVNKNGSMSFEEFSKVSQAQNIIGATPDEIRRYMKEKKIEDFKNNKKYAALEKDLNFQMKK